MQQETRRGRHTHHVHDCDKRASAQIGDRVPVVEVGVTGGDGVTVRDPVDQEKERKS